MILPVPGSMLNAPSSLVVLRVLLLCTKVYCSASPSRSVSLPVRASCTSYTSVPFAMLSDKLFTVASSMTGALSLSTMVPIASLPPMVSLTVSSASSMLSLVVGTLTVKLVTPVGTVILPVLAS
ncbi:Uncharacterised protein [Vibrio cholerae]|nr:Uncharacterised protein [Vibrio cholerae]